MDARFQVCFTPLAAVLFAFPSRYLFAIGHQGVFSLGGWSPRIRTEFHVLRPTRDARGPGRDFGYGAFTRCGLAFQPSSPILSGAVSGSRNPGKQASRFGLVRFRSPLLAQSRLISSPRGTEMFHFPRCRFAGLFDSSGDGGPRGPSGCPIRKPPDQSLLTAPRSLSQSSASFVAS